MKRLIKQLRLKYKNADMNIYRSAQNVNLNTLLSYTKNGETHTFLEDFNKRKEELKEKNKE